MLKALRREADPKPMRTPRGAWPLIVAAVFGAVLFVVPTASARPKAPVGLLPANGKKLAQLPIFTWSPVKGIDHYEFQLSADKGFNSTVKSNGGTQTTKNTAVTIPAGIASGTYWWRIRGVTAKSATSAWTKGRSFALSWAPVTNVTGPADGTAFTIPPASLSASLVLRWAPMPGAAQYAVSIAKDPLLSSIVLAGGNPDTVDGTSYTIDGRLPDGTYYWSVTPIDAEGHKGLPSTVRSFTEQWLSSAGVPTMTDIASGDQLLDPLFSWSPVYGASQYEIEISTSQDFVAGSKVCCGNMTTATAFSPTTLFQDNQYFWRVRPYDASGVPGPWTVGAPFTTTFDNVPPLVAPSITNIHLRDMTDVGSNSQTMPVIEWDPVMGASYYQLEIDNYDGNGCDESNPYGHYTVANTAWSPLASASGAPVVGNAGPRGGDQDSFVPAGNYCVKLRAVDTDSANNAVPGDWTFVNNYTAPTFTYQPTAPTTTPPCNGGWLCANDYVEPAAGAIETSTPPVFVWKPVTGAQGYYIVISKDPNFTNILDYAYTDQTTYTPRDRQYADETSPIYWAIMPTASPNGGPVLAGSSATLVTNSNKQLFSKQTPQPTLTALNTDGAGVAFQWAPQIGAAYYSLQVSTDPSYSNLLEDITTDSASYTAAKSYPAGQTLWYRIRATDASSNGGAWATGTFTRTLAAPVALPATGDINPTSLDGIPTWGWSAVPGAVSYDVHVDYPNGTTQDDNGIQPTATTFSKFDGPGIWKWKVRAEFPTGGTGTLPGPYSATQTFTRTFGEPQGRRAVVTKTRLIFSWGPKQGAKTYHVQVATNADFSSTIDDVTQDTTSFAPSLSSSGYTNGGLLLWRVAAVDAEGNQGDWSPAAKVALAKAIKVSGSATPSKGKSLAVKVTVLDANNKPIKNATVRVAGAGTPPRAKRTNKKGVVILKVRPTSKGDVIFQATKAGYQLGKLVDTIS
jgi:hypothetical protein